jgi:hypothetical protein
MVFDPLQNPLSEVYQKKETTRVERMILILRNYAHHNVQRKCFELACALK